jgi:phosphoribosylglycinamide formyltransferase 1
MIRLAMLISGSGTTAQSVLSAWQKGKLPGIQPVLVLASRDDAAGIAKAKAFGVTTAVVNPKRYESQRAFGEGVLGVLRKFRVTLVSQNGWLPLTPPGVIEAYKGKIINQHPGPLDPGRDDYGGKGMYGRRVAAARLAYAWMAGGENWTESTVHHVTREFDKGEIIRIEALPFPLPSGGVISRLQLQERRDEFAGAVDDLAKALLPSEHMNVIAVLKEYGERGNFSQFVRKNVLVPASKRLMLAKAKEFAIQVFPNG